MIQQFPHWKLVNEFRNVTHMVYIKVRHDKKIYLLQAGSARDFNNPVSRGLPFS